MDPLVTLSLLTDLHKRELTALERVAEAERILLSLASQHHEMQVELQLLIEESVYPAGEAPTVPGDGAA